MLLSMNQKLSSGFNLATSAQLTHGQTCDQLQQHNSTLTSDWQVRLIYIRKSRLCTIRCLSDAHLYKLPPLSQVRMHIQRLRVVVIDASLLSLSIQFVAICNAILLHVPRHNLSRSARHIAV